MKINSILLKNCINNSSDIKVLLKNKNINRLLSNIDAKKIIKVNSHLIHKKDITLIEQFIFNLDNYISFIKSLLNISPLQTRYIIDLTLDNKYNKILLSDVYFYDNKDYYINEFKKLFMYKYIKNVNKLKKYINIDKLDFDSLILKLNYNKNKAHFYFEDISKNLPYYIDIIDYLENTSNI